MSKFWLKSKTIVFNLTIGLASLLALYSIEFEEVLGRKGFVYVLIITSVVNLILRSVTSASLEFKK